MPQQPIWWHGLAAKLKTRYKVDRTEGILRGNTEKHSKSSGFIANLHDYAQSTQFALCVDTDTGFCCYEVAAGDIVNWGI